MIYFSIIGTHDTSLDIRDPHTTSGAVITIFMKYKDVIDTVYLFTTKTGDGSEQIYKDTADKVEKVFKSESSKIKLTQIELDFTPSPIDYDIVYHEMLNKISMIMDGNSVVRDADKIINITSGTATMTASWLLLQQSGIIPNAKMVQSFNKDFQRKRGVTCEEVNLDVEGFPTILPPDVLVRELKKEQRKNDKLVQEVNTQDTHNRFPALIGRSLPMKKVKDDILRLAPTDNNVLILGEPGTGKELLAKYLHESGNRSEKRFFKINLGGKSSSIIDSELFGHKKGSFTNAVADRKGYFREYDGETIFLDEIGDVSLDIQEKLLRVIEYGEVIPQGEDKTYKVDVKIISATNADIAAKVKKKELRKDFLSRLGQIISVSPLRDRRDDIDEIIKTKYPDLNLSKKCIKELVNEKWDGANVRELLSTLESAGTLSQDEPIERDQIPSTAMDLLKDPYNEIILPGLPLAVPLKEFENLLIDKALNIYPTQAEAASSLGIKPDTLKKRLFRLKKTDI